MLILSRQGRIDGVTIRRYTLDLSEPEYLLVVQGIERIPAHELDGLSVRDASEHLSALRYALEKR